MVDEYDVTITDVFVRDSVASGLPVVNLVLLPHGLHFFEGRVVSKLYSGISNFHPQIGWRRAGLRRILGMVISSEPFTDSELRSMIGRRLRVSVEETEFQETLRLRVVDFLYYSGDVNNPSYSDNEYVFMMRELLQEVK